MPPFRRICRRGSAPWWSSAAACDRGRFGCGLPLRPPILGRSLLVLRYARREAVRSGAVGPQNEVKRRGLRGTESRLEGCQAGIGDRAGRQSGMPVRVIRVLAVEIGAVDHAVVAVGQ